MLERHSPSCWSVTLSTTLAHAATVNQQLICTWATQRDVSLSTVRLWQTWKPPSTLQLLETRKQGQQKPEPSSVVRYCVVVLAIQVAHHCEVLP